MGKESVGSRLGLKNREGAALRILAGGETADRLHILRSHQYVTAEGFDLLTRSVAVLDGKIDHPIRRYRAPGGIDRKHTASLCVATFEDGVIHFWHRKF